MTDGRRRRARITATGVLVAAVTAACGGVSTGGEDGDTGGATTITTMGFGLPDEIATTRVKAYEKASGNTVKVNEGGFDEQQFLSAVASGNPPDVVYLDRNIIGTYAARGAIQPLDDCVQNADVDMDVFRDAATSQVTIDGTVYGIPEFYSVRVVIGNDSVLDAAGLTIDDVATGDWQQIAAASKAMAAVSGGNVERIGYDPKLPEFLPLWAHANGGRLLSEDGRTATLDDPKVVEAVEFGASLVADAGGWAAFSAFRNSWDFFGEENQYAADQLGAMPMEDWYVNQLAEVSRGEAGITVAPFLDRQGEPVTYATGQAWAVPKGAKHPDEACEFAATMTAADTWVAAAKARAEALRAEGGAYTGTFTGNEAADEKIFSEVYQPVDDPALASAVETILSVQDKAFSLPPAPASAEFQKAYQDAVTRVLEGKQSAAEAMAQAQQVAQKALDDASSGG
jgi:multiple sugar transport system substrate-binding protein